MQINLKIYDMSQTTEIKGVFYERLQDGRYRRMETFCADNFTFVTNKLMISKLDKIFGVKK